MTAICPPNDTSNVVNRSYQWLNKPDITGLKMFTGPMCYQEVTVIGFEGISGTGKTSLLQLYAKKENVYVYSLDFFEEFIEKEENKIINWMTKPSSPILTSFYINHLRTQIQNKIQEVDWPVTTVLFDRLMLSSTLYDTLFSLTYEKDKKAATDEVVKKFKVAWEENQGTHLCKTYYGNELNAYIVVVDSNSKVVLDRIMKRNTVLDSKIIPMFENYPEVQTIIWSYVAKDLNLALVDLNGGFLSDNVGLILSDCGIDL